MFQDYKINKYLGINLSNHRYEYQITIIDTEFIETVIVSAYSKVSSTIASEQRRALRAIVAAIIQLYQNKNIAHNLYLLCRKINETYSLYSIENQIEDSLKYVEGFSKYKEEILQYHKRYNNQKAFW